MTRLRHLKGIVSPREYILIKRSKIRSLFCLSKIYRFLCIFSFTKDRREYCIIMSNIKRRKAKITALELDKFIKRNFKNYLAVKKEFKL